MSPPHGNLSGKSDAEIARILREAGESEIARTRAREQDAAMAHARASHASDDTPPEGIDTLSESGERRRVLRERGEHERPTDAATSAGLVIVDSRGHRVGKVPSALVLKLFPILALLVGGSGVEAMHRARDGAPAVSEASPAVAVKVDALEKAFGAHVAEESLRLTRIETALESVAKTIGDSTAQLGVFNSRYESNIARFTRVESSVDSLNAALRDWMISERQRGGK